jgi:hypothetical protein
MGDMKAVFVSIATISVAFERTKDCDQHLLRQSSNGVLECHAMHTNLYAMLLLPPTYDLLSDTMYAALLG